MKSHRLTGLILSLVFISFGLTLAEQPKPFSGVLKSDIFLNKIHEWVTAQRGSQESQLCLTAPVAIAGALSFMASSISSAGGIGGGGIYIPILSIVAGIDLKTASFFTAFMVTGGSFANVMYHLCTTSSKFGGKPLIDYDIALLSEPCMLLGVSLGVICNSVFPEWLITVLFALFLAWCTSRTCKRGIMYWKNESEEQIKNGELENGVTEESEELKSTSEPLLSNEENSKMRLPWMKLGILILVWFSFFLIYLLRGDGYEQSIIGVEPCGMWSWILLSLQIPLAVVFTAWTLYGNESLQDQALIQEGNDTTRDRPSCKPLFPLMALLAGTLGGVFGIGGGILISPILLQFGIKPEVTAATCSFMVFFSSTMSAFQYVFLNIEHIKAALIFAFICFVGSLLGLLLIQKAVQKHGRASLIVFSVGLVMGLSTVLMTSYGALDVWKDYKSGKYMGFKLPC